MKPEEKYTSINDILKWMKGSNPLKYQRCFILNFGYMESFPYPDVKLTPDFEFYKSVGTFHVQAFPSKCCVPDGGERGERRGGQGGLPK